VARPSAAERGRSRGADRGTDVADLSALAAVVAGARCWGIELDARYRVLALTIEPDPLRTPGTAGMHQLLCFPVSVLLAALTRPVIEDGRERTALVTFDLEQLTAVSERLGGATIGPEPFGRPEPRPGAWGPRYSLEGRSSAADGTRTTLTIDLTSDDGARLRLFARCDDVELRDAGRRLVLGTSPGGAPERAPTGGPGPAGASDAADGPEDAIRF
jgi:hypothetical protein